MAPPVLWQFRFSHYNEKARWALDWKGIPHVRRSLLPALHVPRVLWLTGQKSVPVLVLDGRAIADSTRIIETLERRHPDPPLYPREAELQPSGYLVGDRFGVADLTAAALLSPLVRPLEFPYALPGPPSGPAGAFRASVASRPAFRWVEEMYRRHRGTSAEVPS